MKCIDDEIPFEIPQSWCWVRLGNIGDWGSGSTPAKGRSDYYGGNVLWLRTGELNNGIVYDTEIKITDKALQECSFRLNKVGDVMIAMYGATIGKVAIAGKEMTTNQACCGCTPICILNKYLFYFLMGSQEDFIKKGEGGAQPNISREKIVAHLMPLPPFEEQNRIVEKIESILPLIELYGKSQDKLNALNKSIFPLLRKSVLQEAIQGRLVPQDPNDEPASKLLERIKEEKTKLFKEGKLKKKDLVDSVIFKGEDNKYYETIDGITTPIESVFDYPDSWEVMRLHSICLLSDGVRQTGSQVCLDAKYLRGKATATLLQQGKFVKKGDNIILVDGENSGEVFTVPIDGYMGSTFKQLWISRCLYLPYILTFIRYYKDELRNSKKGAAIPHLNKDIFNNLIIGIPPYDEQVRIVDRLNLITSSLN